MAIIIPSRSIYSPINDNKQKRNKIHVVKYTQNKMTYSSVSQSGITLEFGDVLSTEYSTGTSYYIEYKCKEGQNSNYYITSIYSYSAGNVPGFTGYSANGYTILELQYPTDWVSHATLSPEYQANHNISILINGFRRPSGQDGNTFQVDGNSEAAWRYYFAVTGVTALDSTHIQINFTVYTLQSTDKTYGIQSVTLSIPEEKYYSLTEENESLSYDDGLGTETYQMPDNELYQDINVVSAGTVAPDGTTLAANTPIGAFNAEYVNKAYKNGKEIISLKCSMVDYYDEYGNIAKSLTGAGNPMFDIGDTVIPMKNTISGDSPMALDLNGNAKKFTIIAVELVFDGAIWQQLVLQEIN